MSDEPGQRSDRLRTAQDAPVVVRRLLKSYDPAALHWDIADDRYAVVVAILTRGNAEARAWLSGVLSYNEIRELVRSYAGASCAEPDRARSREQYQLTTTDIPRKPYVGFG
jgi:hypothetical protein